MISRVYRRSPVGTRLRMEGAIGAAGFATGDRVVVGLWTRSPVGPLSDVMWASPTGVRTLHVGRFPSFCQSPCASTPHQD